jgi:hypothetical protein
MSFVHDTPITMAWCFDDEADSCADSVLEAELASLPFRS